MRWILFSALLGLPLLGAKNPDWKKYFDVSKGCFEIEDLQTGTRTVSSKDLCARRFPACSTFKVPLALIAFEKKLLLDRNSVLKWDGRNHSIATWNKDHNPETWLRDSVVWFSQRLTVQLGVKSLEDYLKRFSYGTADVSGGIETAWLTEGRSTVLISADEQVAFFKRFVNGKLELQKETYETVKAIMPREKIGSVNVLGKTGSGSLNDKGRDWKLGWYVGILENQGKNYAFAFWKEGDPTKGYAGPQARETALKILSNLSL